MTEATRELLKNLGAILVAVAIIVGYYVFMAYRDRQEKQACYDRGGGITISQHGDGWTCHLPPWVDR